MDEDFTRRAKWFVERPLVQLMQPVLTLIFVARVWRCGSRCKQAENMWKQPRLKTDENIQLFDVICWKCLLEHNLIYGLFYFWSIRYNSIVRLNRSDGRVYVLLRFVCIYVALIQILCLCCVAMGEGSTFASRRRVLAENRMILDNSADWYITKGTVMYHLFIMSFLWLAWAKCTKMHNMYSKYSKICL